MLIFFCGDGGFYDRIESDVFNDNVFQHNSSKQCCQSKAYGTGICRNVCHWKVKCLLSERSRGIYVLDRPFVHLFLSCLFLSVCLFALTFAK